MKKFVLCAVLFITTGNLTADQFGSSITLSTSVSWGRAYEHVYKGSFTDDLLSELLWDIRALTFAEAKKTRYLNDSLHMSFSLSSRTASAWGTMTDMDWIGSSSEWTHFSESKALVHTASSADFRTSWRYDDPIWFHGGLRYDLFEWEDRAYTYIYPSGEGSFDGARAIDYLQMYLIPYGGISFLLSQNSHTFQAGASISPAVFALARDFHRLIWEDRTWEDRKRFLDWSFFGFYLSLEGEYSLRVSDNFEITAGIDARFLPSSRGSNATYTYKEGTSFDMTKNTVGIGMWIVQPSIGIRISYPD